MEKSLLILEFADNEIKPVSYEMVAASRKLHDFLPGDPTAVVLGSKVLNPAETFAQRTGLDVIAIESEELEYYNSELHCKLLRDLIDEIEPGYILGANTTRGLDCLPGLSVAIGASCITGIEKLELYDDRLHVWRSICSGKLTMRMVSDSQRHVLCLQPGSFQLSDETPAKAGKVTSKPVAAIESRISNREILPHQADDSLLREAKSIIAAGRGIGDEENLELIRELASHLPRSAVGGSRPLCDLGWLEYGQQVGITGATVSPELYIACGVSGTSQHVMGMKGSGFVVSINKDPNAAIFNISDLCIVDDLTEFIPILIEKIKKRKESGEPKSKG